MSVQFRRDSLLSLASSSSGLTPLQSQVDGLVGGFVEQATDLRSLAAMAAGGMTYRLGRMGAMAVGTGRLASLGIGLGAEVTAFEMTNRSLASLTGDTHSNPNLWRWDGQGGIRQGFLSSLITFGSLKGAGRLAQGENGVVQHLLQDTGMVLGHQVSGSLGITDKPQGTLAEQFLHAEVTNLQLSAGMALAHNFAPGIQGVERGLDLSLRTTDVGATPRGRPELEGSHMGLPLQIGPQPILAAVGGRELSVPRPHENIAGPTVLLAERWDDAREIDPSIQDELSSVRSRPNLPPQPPVFKDPIEALREADLPEDYEPGRVYRIAKEGENELTAISRGLTQMWNGPNHEVDYFLNGVKIGYATLQFRSEEKTMVGLDVRIDPFFRGRGLSKSIALYHLYLTHQKGWTRVMDMIVNRQILASTTKPFHDGQPMFTPGARVQMRAPTLDPFEPELVDVGPAIPLESFDANTAVFDNFRAYRIMGRPNARLFDRIEQERAGGLLAFEVPKIRPGRRVSRSILSSEAKEYPFELLLGTWDQLAFKVPHRQVPIAIRGEFPMTVAFYYSPTISLRGSFLQGDMEEWMLKLNEMGTKGHATVFIEPRALGLYGIDTVHPEVNKGWPMNPGAGTIFMEWMATEAALHGMGFNVLQIENPHVFEILNRSALIDPATALVEACKHINPFERRYRIEAVFPFVGFDPGRVERPHFWNVRGQPHPRLLADISPRR